MKKRLPIILYYTFLIIFLEFIYRAYILNNLFSLNTLVVIVFSIPFILLFTLLSSLFNKKINKIMTIIWSVLITFVFGSQLIYYKFYGSIFSIYSAKLGAGQVFGDFFEEIFDKIISNIVVIIIIVLPTLLLIIFNKKIFDFKRSKKLFRIEVILLVIYSLIITLIVNLDNEGLYSLKRLYKESHAPMITINKVGLLSMEVLDIKRCLFGFEEKLYKIDFNEEEPIKEEEKEKVVTYNILDIDFDNLIENEENETVKSMHEYFKDAIASKQNDYTGMFEGKNLIYITAEGLDKIAIDEEITPTLYKMATNGFVFENYYQPLFTVSTSDGEYMFMNSLIPKEGVWSFHSSANIYLPYGLGTVFNKLNYQSVLAYHDHTYNYYYRDESHPNLGFTNYTGCWNGLEKKINCLQWPESDVEMIDATINDYIDSDNFMIYYMTVSGHLNYTFTGNMMAYKNRSLVTDLPYSEHVQAYLAANIELDKAMENLLNYLEEAGKLDDTVIVLSPDHYPYGLKDDELNEKSETDRSNKFEKYHTSLILYNSAIQEPIKVNKYVSSIDVLPTVYNLFGIEFDSRLLMGRDALSDAEGLVMLSDRSWINENASYNSINGEYNVFNENVREDYKELINYKVNQKFTMSSLLLYEKNGVYLDYYRKLGI